MKQVPGTFSGRKPVSVSETPVAVEPGASKAPNAVARHSQFMLANTEPLLVQQLHDQLNIEQSILWQNTLASEFEVLDFVAIVESSVFPDVAKDSEELSARDISLGELERMLAGM
jgi:hypothetical protein